MTLLPRSGIARELDAVCFDCWGTLLVEVNGQVVHARRVERLRACAIERGNRVSMEAAREALDRAWHRHWMAWQQGESSSAIDIAHHALAGLHADTPGAAEDLVAQLAESVRGHEVAALPGARRALEGLARSGLRLALVCDTGFTTGDGVRRLLDAQGLLEWLDVQAFSDEAGVSKPHPKIFQHALAALRSRPERALHVGDLRRTDVAGARALGMRTIRIRGAYDDLSDHPEADAVVDSHDALSTLLGLHPNRELEETR